MGRWMERAGADAVGEPLGFSPTSANQNAKTPEPAPADTVGAGLVGRERRQGEMGRPSIVWALAIDRWQRENAALLGPADLALGRDYGGYCAAHRRVLSYPEQQRGACSWCVPVDPEREAEYWASHWRKFTEVSE